MYHGRFKGAMLWRFQLRFLVTERLEIRTKLSFRINEMLLEPNQVIFSKNLLREQLVIKQFLSRLNLKR